MATGGNPLTPVKSATGKVSDNKHCIVCGESIVIHSGYFNIFSKKSKERHLAEFLSNILQTVVSETTAWSVLICKKCLRTLEKCSASLNELNKLRESHRTNTQKWHSENPELNREKRCTKSPSYGTKRSRGEEAGSKYVHQVEELSSRSAPLINVKARQSLVLAPSDKENVGDIETLSAKVEVSNNSSGCSFFIWFTDST